MKEKKFKCVICKRLSDGYGHNPVPVAFHGRCCDKCNKTVIMVRIMQTGTVIAENKKGGNNENA